MGFAVGARWRRRVGVIGLRGRCEVASPDRCNWTSRSVRGRCEVASLVGPSGLRGWSNRARVSEFLCVGHSMRSRYTRKPKSEKPGAEVLAPIPAEILDQIVRDGPLTAAEVESATRRFKKALIERALGAELTYHLGYAAGAPKPEL